MSQECIPAYNLRTGLFQDTTVLFDTTNDVNNISGINNLTVEGALVVNGTISVPYFRAIKASDSIASGSTIPITVFDSVSGSMTSNFNLSNGRFTPPVNGFYQLTAKYFFGTASTDHNVISIVGSDGTKRLESLVSNYSSIIATVSGGVWLSSSLYYNVTIYQGIINPLPISAIEFSGFLVSV